MPVKAVLPKTRVSEAIPFSRTGLDHLGPMYIKTSDGQRKVDKEGCACLHVW